MSQIKPVRIQRSRQRKQVSPNGLPIVQVTRPGKYGNHFTVHQSGTGDWFVNYNIPNNMLAGIVKEHADGYYKTKALAIEKAVACYRVFVNQWLKEHPNWLDELKGKNISCWCKPGSSCHGDVLLELANQ